METLVWFMMAVVMLVSSAECRQPVLHRVGGGQYTWAPNVNFTEWATHEKFYVGDWLYFGFDKRRYNVLEVNKTSYDKCIEKNFIRNITRGGRDVFNLTEAKPYYFLGGRGYCSKGMKVAVDAVQDAPQPDPAPLLKVTNASPSSNINIFLKCFASAMLWNCLVNCIIIANFFFGFFTHLVKQVIASCYRR